MIYLGVIILLPLIFGIFCLIGALYMSDEHSVLKIALYLLSLSTVFSSLHFAQVVVSSQNPEMSSSIDLIGNTLLWIGRIFFLIIAYFLIYAIYKGFRIAAQEKAERLNY